MFAFLPFLVPCPRPLPPLRQPASVEPYGGVVFAYSSSTVRLWCPARSNDGTLGVVINAGNPGWGTQTVSSVLQNGDVRVMAWRRRGTPFFESGWVPMVSFSPSAYVEIVHGLGAVPDYVSVVMKTSEAPNAEYVVFDEGGRDMSCSGVEEPMIVVVFPGVSAD